MGDKKNFKIKAEELIELVSFGGCIATDKITVEGLPVKYMYRSIPNNDIDSGWRFFSGTETQEYIDDLNNSRVYEVNTIANYDQSIIPYLDLPLGVGLEKDENGKFNILSE